MTVRRHQILTVTSGISAAEILAAVTEIPEDAHLLTAEMERAEQGWQRNLVEFTFRREVTDE